MPHPGTPVGATFSFAITDSKVFPGTTRVITVYVPAQYSGNEPACVYVGLDGLSFLAPTVFDNLIAKKEMPVIIAVGISPGVVSSSHAPTNPRFDRSLEFDTRGDRLALFIANEVLPAVEQHRTPAGAVIRLTKDPNHRAIGGASTGGVGAFTVAWERPDLFRRVFTAIGTFVGMRGAEEYYVLVRKTEPKPIRIFMQDGVYDQWPGGPEMGDWWMSNRTMERALSFAGYDVNHVWGSGGHSNAQATQIFPDAMRWLWRDWPSPVAARTPGNQVLQQILEPGADWQTAAEDCAGAVQMAADPRGAVFYPLRESSALAAVPSDGPALPCRAASPEAIAFGGDATLYRATATGGITQRVPEQNANVRLVAAKLSVQGFTVNSDGTIYATVSTPQRRSELWLLSPDRDPVQLDNNLDGAGGVALTPDHLWLAAAESNSHDVLSYRVNAGGLLNAREPLYMLYVPASADDSGAASIAFDRDGRAYVGTRMGVQVLDRNGRVIAILPLPKGEAATSLCFGGPQFDILYVSAGSRIYRRHMRVQGVPPWAPPVALPSWGPG